MASILVFLCFGVTQAKDGPFSRPHPGNSPFLFPCVPAWRFCSERSLCLWCWVWMSCPSLFLAPSRPAGPHWSSAEGEGCVLKLPGASLSAASVFSDPLSRSAPPRPCSCPCPSGLVRGALQTQAPQECPVGSSRWLGHRPGGVRPACKFSCLCPPPLEVMGSSNQPGTSAGRRAQTAAPPTLPPAQPHCGQGLVFPKGHSLVT